MISIAIDGHPVPHPPVQVLRPESLYALTYDGWKERVRRCAVRQLGPGPELLDGVLVMAVRLRSVVWERERVDQLVQGVLDGLEGLLYENVSQVGKLLVEKVPVPPGGDEGAVVTVWPAHEYEAKFGDALAALFEAYGT